MLVTDSSGMSFSSLGSHTPRGEPRQTDNAVERKQTLWQTDSFPLAWTRSKSQTGEKPHSIAASFAQAHHESEIRCLLFFVGNSGGHC